MNIIISKEEREEKYEKLKELPENDSLFKCFRCRTIFDIYSGGLPVLMALSDKSGILCPECKSDSTELICKVDAYSVYLKMTGFNCREGLILNGTDICPICKTSMCPQCMNHSVVSLSRVTGYIQDVAGWNMAKKQELIDRKRYGIGSDLDSEVEFVESNVAESVVLKESKKQELEMIIA